MKIKRIYNKDSINNLIAKSAISTSDIREVKKEKFTKKSHFSAVFLSSECHNSTVIADSSSN